MSTNLRRWLGALYATALLPLLVNYIMGFGWFRPYDQAVLLVGILISTGITAWLRKHADQELAQQFALQALDAKGGLQSDPAARGFVRKVMVYVLATVVVISAMMWYRDREKDDLSQLLIVLVSLLIIVAVMMRRWYGDVYEIERDEGRILSLRRGGKELDIPWSAVQSISVEKSRGAWQVALKYRLEGETKDGSVVIFPLGFLKMSTVSAEKLQAALEGKRLAPQRT